MLNPVIREFPNPVYYTRENSIAYRLPHSHDTKPGNEEGETYIALMITEGIIIAGKQLRLRIKRQIEINPRYSSWEHMEGLFMYKFIRLVCRSRIIKASALYTWHVRNSLAIRLFRIIAQKPLTIYRLLPEVD